MMGFASLNPSYELGKSRRDARGPGAYAPMIGSGSNSPRSTPAASP
jgi:hypothetical protein